MELRWSGTKALFVLAGLGCVAGVAGAVYLNRQHPPQAPVFAPAQNPYAQGIYANGIVESDQPNGSNVNLYPEVSGTVTQILAHEGQLVTAGTPLLTLDERVQRATAEQQKSQADASQAMLEELKAEPRPEALRVAQAQLVAAEASARTAKDQYDKVQHAFDVDAHAVSRDALDSARNSWLLADANRATAVRQLELTRAGAWAFDVRNQTAQHAALEKAWQAANVQLEKFTLRAPSDGVVLSIRAAVGSYVTPQGSFDPYTEASNLPLLVLGSPPGRLNVRCYIDEILIPRLPPGGEMKARMSIRGTTTNVPLEFVRIEPYVSPKIQLSDQRQERVDVRVLPVIFRFENPAALNLYSGQLVDVYIGR